MCALMTSRTVRIGTLLLAASLGDREAAPQPSRGCDATTTGPSENIFQQEPGGASCQPITANVCSYPMERRYELEALRRSLAMLRPGAPALDREEAMRLVRELQDLERQLRRLRRGLQELLSDSR